MSSTLRVVIDTNVLVSALLSFKSTSAQAVRRTLSRGLLLLSEPALSEIESVLGRQKFSKVLSTDTRKAFVKSLRLAAEHVSITSHLRRCRDPRDDRFLELAVDGNADVIVTGDDDLLALDPFGQIRILTPKQFLDFDVGHGDIPKE